MVHVKVLPPRFLLFVAMTFYILFASVVSAQDMKQKIKFSAFNQAGLLVGNQGEALSVQTINGIRKGKSFAGVGTGFDFYKDRSIPLFLDYRRDLSTAKNTPFAYVDAGLNFLWLNFIEKEQRGIPSSSSGFYYDFGLGWRLSGKNNRALIVSLGYTLKQLKYKVLSYSVAPTAQMQAENYDRYNFLYRRLVLKVGFQL